MPWTCGPKCPFWNQAEDKCVRPDVSAEWVKQGQNCLDSPEDWHRRPGEIQDEIVVLQREADLYAAAIAARRAAGEVS
jgi:hypothetical protein